MSPQESHEKIWRKGKCGDFIVRFGKSQPGSLVFVVKVKLDDENEVFLCYLYLFFFFFLKYNTILGN